MTRALRLMVPALVGLSSLAAADSSPAPLLTNSPTRRLPLVVDDVSLIERANLYMTSDGGASWHLAQELVPTPGETPRFTFTAPADGVYGFASAVIFKDGHREPEPRPGQVPQLQFRFDTTPPTVDRFTARAESVVGNAANVRFAWGVSDALLGDQPATIEISADGGTTFAPLQRSPAQGNLLAAVPMPPSGQRLAVRLRAEDRAGNLTLSAVALVDTAAAAAAPAAPTAPAPANTPAAVPDQQLAAALAALPTLEEPQKPKAPTPPAPAPAAEPAPAIPAPVAVEPTGPLVPAEPPPVRTARPEIVEPNRPIPPPVSTGDEVEVVQGPGLEAEYRAAQSGPAPAWQTGKERPSSLGVTSEPETAPEPAKPVAPRLPPDVPPSGMLTPTQAQILLVKARAAAQNGDDVTAVAYYRRLRSSSIASSAIFEEARLLRSRNRLMDALATIEGAPADQIDDALRIEHGRLLIALRRPRESIAPLTAVRKGSPLADEALFVAAQALAADGKPDQAKKVFAALAAGQGPWSAAAKQQLGK